MLSLRDRFVRHFTGEPGVRPPFMQVFGPMRETALRWAGQGTRAEAQWFLDVGFEGAPNKQFGNLAPVNSFVCPQFEPEVLADDGAIVIRRNAWGTIVKVHADGNTMPYPAEFPVKDAASWAEMKRRLLPDSGPRFPDDWETRKRELDGSDELSYVGGLPCGFFGAPRELFGVENWLTCFYDDPGLAHEVLDTLCDLWCEVLGRVAREMRVDFLFIWEDMCYRNGPLLSPAVFREFMLPRYQRLTSTLREAGVPLMLVDTDGNFDKLTPLFVEGGVDIAIPFEVQSKMDAAATRELFPEFGVIGAVEKTTPSQCEAAVEAALAGIADLLRTGRFLPCSDHGVPPTVSYEDYVAFYRRVGELVRGAGAA